MGRASTRPASPAPQQSSAGVFVVGASASRTPPRRAPSIPPLRRAPYGPAVLRVDRALHPECGAADGRCIHVGAVDADGGRAEKPSLQSLDVPVDPHETHVRLGAGRTDRVTRTIDGELYVGATVEEQDLDAACPHRAAAFAAPSGSEAS